MKWLPYRKSSAWATNKGKLTIYSSNFTVIYDACVLYPAPLRDILVQLAGASIFRARWTEQIHNEWIRNVHRDRPEISLESLKKCRLLMDRYIPDCLVEGYESLVPELELPDKNDRHVLAAAIRAGASAIITFNLKDFPPQNLESHGVDAILPDEFILDVIGLEPEAVLESAQKTWRRLKNPPLTWEGYLENLTRCGLVQTAYWLSQQ